MNYIKKHTSDKRDIHVLLISYDYRDGWHYSSQELEMSGYLKEEVIETIKKIRDICSISKQGQEACEKAFDKEDKIVIKLKTGVEFLFDLHSHDGKEYPIIDIDTDKSLTYFDHDGEEFIVQDW